MFTRRVVLFALVCACVPDGLAAQSFGRRRGRGEDRPGITGVPRQSGEGGGSRGRRAGAEPSEPEDFPIPSGRGQSEWPRPASPTPPRNPGEAWDTERRARPTSATPPANPNVPGEDTERRRRLNQAGLDREERLARREREIEEGVRRYREEAERDFDERRRERRDRQRRSVR